MKSSSASFDSSTQQCETETESDLHYRMEYGTVRGKDDVRIESWRDSATLLLLE